MRFAPGEWTRTWLSGLAVVACASALAAQSRGGNAVDQDIPARLEVPTGESLGPDALTSYSNDEAGVGCFVGRRRTISMSLARRGTRTMWLVLGTELAPWSLGFKPSGEPDRDNPTGVPPFAGNVPLPSGEITEVAIQLAGRENVSALGAFRTDANVPNYCWPGTLEEVPDDIQPNDPSYDDSYTTMCTTMRMDFKAGVHRWRLFFGPPNRRHAQGFHWTPWSTGPVVIQRVFGQGDVVDPLNPLVPWTIRVEGWNNPDDENDPRNGKVVGFLFYSGTKQQDPDQYVGAFEIPWATTTPWETYPVQ